MADNRLQLRLVDDEWRAYRDGVELPMRRTEPPPPPPVDFVCVCCEEPRQERHNAGRAGAAGTICAYCVSFTRGVGYNLRVSNGDRDTMRRLVALTDRLTREARHARTR